MDSSLYLTLLDEIALEGLRGITFEALWLRLQDRDRFLARSNKSLLFKFKQDEQLHDLVFQIILKEARRGNIKFYKLPEARKKLQIYDRNQNFVPKSGTLIVDDSKIPDDLYPPICTIKNPSDNPDDQNQVKGSCEHFESRIDITKQITFKDFHKSKCSFKDFKKKYKINQIVVVASQKLRAVALFGQDRWQEYVEMKPESYVILESIGSKRWYGEMNLGKEAPRYQDPKIKTSFHYFRKLLSKNKLIFTLYNSVFLEKRQQISLVSITYLPRFRPLMLNQNDWKIIELSKLFIQRGNSKLPLSELEPILLEQFGLKPLFLKTIRNFFARYSFIIKIYVSEDKNVMFEYLKPLDRPLNFDDLYQACGNQETNSNENQNTTDHRLESGELEENKKHSGGKKNQSIYSDSELDDNEEDYDDDDKNSTIVKAENFLDDLDEEDFDEDLDRVVGNKYNPSNKILWSNLELEIPDQEPMDEDFDYATFFNVKKSLSNQSSHSKTTPIVIDDHQQDLSFEKSFFLKQNNNKIEEISKVKNIKKLEIFDRKLRNSLKIVPKCKFITTRQNLDGQLMEVHLIKLQQIPRYLEDRFLWLINQVGKITRPKLVRLFDLPINLIRNLISHLRRSSDLTFTVQRLGRQSIHQFETTFSSSATSTNTALSLSSSSKLGFESNNNERLQIRIQFILEYLRDVRISDSIAWIKRYIAQREINLGFLVDQKSIMRILNHLVDMKLVRLYHYCFSYRTYFRNSFFIIYNNNDSIDDSNSNLIEPILEHLILRTLFILFGRFPINLKQDVNIQSILREDGKINLASKITNLINTTQNITDQHQSNENCLIDPEICPAYCPAMAAHLYGCRNSKIEKMFELYRFLFHLFVATDNEYNSNGTLHNSSENNWQLHVPKLTQLNRKFALIDILPYIPLTILRNIVSIRYEVPGLDEFLNDPLKRNLMLHEVPPSIRSHLLYNRKVNAELQELLMSLSYFRLLTLVEKIIKDKKYTHRFQYVLNTRIELKQQQQLEEQELSESTNLMIEHNFQNISDFDQFTELVYNHLFDKPTMKCLDCPFDSRLNLHSIHFNASKFVRHNEPIPDDASTTEQSHQRKRKQNLKHLKNKRIKMEVMVNNQPVKKNKNKKENDNNHNLNDKNNNKSRQSSSNSLRVSWSREEDQFVLKCRLVSALMNTPPMFRFAVPLDIVRDLLHSHLGPGSYDKTSGACARRLLRLVRRPHIKRVLTICLMELKSSLSLPEDGEETESEIFDDSSSAESPNPLVRRFKKLLSQILSYRFVNTEFFMTKEELNISSFSGEENLDLDHLLSRYDIINPCQEAIDEYYFDPKNYYDIHSYVITNVLMSSLISFRLHHHQQEQQQYSLSKNRQRLVDFNNQDSKYLKRYFMRTVFKALKHFPDTLVRLVLKRLVQFRFITHNKKNDQKDRKLQPYAYKLGNVFFRDLSTHHFIYGLTFNQNLKYQNGENPSLCQTVMEDNNSLIGAMEFGENLCVDVLGLRNSSENPSDPTSDSPLKSPKKINHLYPPTMLHDLRFKIDIPKNFICLSKDVLEENRRNSRGLLMNRNSQVCDILMPNHLEEEFGSSSMATSSMIDDMSVIHCKVQMNQLWKVGQQVLPEKILNLFSIHLQFFDPTEFPSAEVTSTLSLSKQISDDIIEFLSKEYLEKISIPFGVDKTFNDMFKFIKSKKELGATIEDLFSFIHFDPDFNVEDSLIDFLFTCQQNKLVFSVGIVTRTWVHRDFIRYWLVHSFKNLDFDVDHLLSLDKSSLKKIRKVCFLPKLWKTPDGNLDLNMLFLFFNRLVGFLVMEPSGGVLGADLDQLAKHFQQFLPKVQLIELLELLLAVDCIRSSLVTTLDNNDNIESLDDFFRKQKTFDWITHPDSSEMENETMYKNQREQKSRKNKILRRYEANIDAFSRLASLYHMLQYWNPYSER